MKARRLAQIQHGERFEIQVDGKPVEAYPGETIATVMLTAGIRSFHHDSVSGSVSRLYCGMGVCLQCLTMVNGEFCQACQTMARPGMKVETQPCQS